jgi:predicted aldo/keto reductase-like oxidoreductase
MNHITLGQTGLKVTPVGFGVLTIGPWQMNLPINEGAAVLRYALERGINFLDSAQYYKTYPYIKKALYGFDKEVIIASKSLVSTYNGMREAIEEARLEMNRDQIEIFMLHEVREGMDWTNRLPAWNYLQEAKAKGLVKAIGLSTHHVEVADFAASIPELDILFPLINFKSMGIRKGSGCGTKEEMADSILKASSAGKGIFGMKVFGGGNLTGSYQEAIRYVQGVPGIASIMIGFGHIEEIDRIIEMMDGTLNTNYVPELSHKKIRIDQGDCIGCQACINRCPNHALYLDSKGIAAVDYQQCITCGYCAPQCPVMAIIMY